MNRARKSFGTLVVVAVAACTAPDPAPGARAQSAAGPVPTGLWVDATEELPDSTAQWTNKVELADVDGDGRVDLVLADGGPGDDMSNEGGRTHLWLNEGPGHFLDRGACTPRSSPSWGSTTRSQPTPTAAATSGSRTSPATSSTSSSPGRETVMRPQFGRMMPESPFYRVCGGRPCAHAPS